MPMFTAALFTIGKGQKRPSVDEWTSKVWYADTIECSSALKRKEILTQATSTLGK